MGLSEIKSWAELKQGTLLWERKQMQFRNRENVACVTQRLVFHSVTPLQPWSGVGPSISKESRTTQPRETLWEQSQVQHIARNIKLRLLQLERGTVAAGETWKPVWGSWGSCWDEMGHTSHRDLNSLYVTQSPLQTASVLRGHLKHACRNTSHLRNISAVTLETSRQRKSFPL